MKFIYKLEKKFGRYAIKNLSIYVAGCMIMSYLLWILFPSVSELVTFDPYAIFARHQYWRIFTWILTPPTGFNYFTLIMIFFYYAIGTSIERGIGTFMYNLYIFSNLFLITISSFIFSMVYYFMSSEYEFIVYSYGSGYGLMTFHLLTSIFLGYALLYQNAYVLLFFVIPFKVKWMAYIEGIFLLYYFVRLPAAISRLTIIAVALNFFLYYLIVRKYSRRGRVSMAQIKRKRAYQRQVREAENEKHKQQMAGITRHKCAICGKTEKDDENLEFRFCSKCKGNYEYCNEHLFTHEHVK